MTYEVPETKRPVGSVGGQVDVPANSSVQAVEAALGLPPVEAPVAPVEVSTTPGAEPTNPPVSMPVLPPLGSTGQGTESSAPGIPLVGDRAVPIKVAPEKTEPPTAEVDVTVLKTAPLAELEAMLLKDNS